IAWTVAILLTIVVVLLNQVVGHLDPSKDKEAEQTAAAETSPAEPEIKPPDELDPRQLAARMLVKLSHSTSFDAAAQQNRQLRAMLLSNLEPPGAELQPADKLRNALIASDIAGTEEGLKRLDDVKSESEAV